MNSLEARQARVGDLLRYSDFVPQTNELCLFLGRPINPNIWDPIPEDSILFKVLVVSQGRCCVLDIPYAWLDKL